MKMFRELKWERSYWILLALVAIALGIRIWGNWFGLPYLLHNDEGNEVLRALQLGTGSFNTLRIYKGGYFYLLFVEYGAFFLFLKSIGAIASPVDFARYFIEDPSSFYLIGRTTTAIIGTGTVFLAYRIGKYAFDPRVGLFAASFLTFNILHAKTSHFVTVDVPLGFLTTLSLYYGLKIARENELGDYIKAALFAAFAATTKITGVFLVVPLVLAHFRGSKNRGLDGNVVADRRLWYAIGVFLLVYIITTPGVVLHFPGLMDMLLRKFGWDVHAAGGAAVVESMAMIENTNLFLFYSNAVLESMGIPLFLVCLCGLLFSVIKRTDTDWILVSFLVITVFVLSIATDDQEFFPRYMSTVIPLLCILGARFLVEFFSVSTSRLRMRTAVIVAALLVAYPGYRIFQDNTLMTRPDTRVLAVEWFEAEVPSQSKVFIEGSRTQPVESTVPLNNTRENILESIKYYAESEPGKAKYLRWKLDTLNGPTYDLETVRPHELRDYSFYKDAGVEYFVLRPNNYPNSRRRFEWPMLVQAIRTDPAAVLLKRFEPDSLSTPGPLIEIYRRSPGFEKD